MSFVDAHRGELGVEPICTALGVAPSTYYAAKRREREPSARAVSDAVWMPILLALWVANRKVYGARKLWKAARRAGHEIGRDQVARLMRELGVRGVSRRRKMFTTRQDPDAVRAPDLVNRDFTADRPDALWVTDLTYVATRAGMAYVCFIVDAFSRRIVGWRVASHMRTEMVLDALEMARRSRGNRRLVGLVAHSDAGSQAGFNRSSQHLDDGGVGDGDDAGAPARGPAVSGSDPVAGASDSRVAAGPGSVLGGDRRRRQDRGRGGTSGGVIPRWVPVVPSRWRGEPMFVPDGVGPVSVVCRA